jgi:hypothetical protein
MNSRHARKQIGAKTEQETRRGKIRTEKSKLKQIFNSTVPKILP